MAEACQRAIDEGIDAIAFGDLFLEDVRAYRERNLAPTGLEPLFPLWKIPTDELAREMIAGGLRSRMACWPSTDLERLIGYQGQSNSRSSLLDAVVLRLPKSAIPQ